MSRIQAICPISMRTAFFGSHRIAPVAEISRTQAWGARPTVEILRPAHQSSQEPQTQSQSETVTFTAPFVAHVLAQTGRGTTSPSQTAAAAYEASEALGRARQHWMVTEA